VPNFVPNLSQVEIAKRSGFEVVGADGAGKLFYVQNLQRADAEHVEVDMRRGLESVNCCSHVSIHKQPCQHMVCVFWKYEMMSTARKVDLCVKKFWPKWARAQVLLQAYKTKRIARPHMYGGPFIGDDADRIGMPIQRSKPKGRPKKARFKYRKRTVKSIAKVMPRVFHAQYSSVLEFF